MLLSTRKRHVEAMAGKLGLAAKSEEYWA